MGLLKRQVCSAGCGCGGACSEDYWSLKSDIVDGVVTKKFTKTIHTDKTWLRTGYLDEFWTLDGAELLRTVDYLGYQNLTGTTNDAPTYDVYNDPDAGESHIGVEIDNEVALAFEATTKTGPMSVEIPYLGELIRRYPAQAIGSSSYDTVSNILLVEFVVPYNWTEMVDPDTGLIGDYVDWNFTFTKIITDGGYPYVFTMRASEPSTDPPPTDFTEARTELDSNPMSGTGFGANVIRRYSANDTVEAETYTVVIGLSDDVTSGSLLASTRRTLTLGSNFVPGFLTGQGDQDWRTAVERSEDGYTITTLNPIPSSDCNIPFEYFLPLEFSDFINPRDDSGNWVQGQAFWIELFQKNGNNEIQVMKQRFWYTETTNRKDELDNYHPDTVADLGVYNQYAAQLVTLGSIRSSGTFGDELLHDYSIVEFPDTALQIRSDYIALDGTTETVGEYFHESPSRTGYAQGFSSQVISDSRGNVLFAGACDYPTIQALEEGQRSGLYFRVHIEFEDAGQKGSPNLLIETVRPLGLTSSKQNCEDFRYCKKNARGLPGMWETAVLTGVDQNDLSARSRLACNSFYRYDVPMTKIPQQGIATIHHCYWYQRAIYNYTVAGTNYNRFFYQNLHECYDVALNSEKIMLPGEHGESVRTFIQDIEGDDANVKIIVDLYVNSHGPRMFFQQYQGAVVVNSVTVDDNKIVIDEPSRQFNSYPDYYDDAIVTNAWDGHFGAAPTADAWPATLTPPTPAYSTPNYVGSPEVIAYSVSGPYKLWSEDSNNIVTSSQFSMANRSYFRYEKIVPKWTGNNAPTLTVGVDDLTDNDNRVGSAWGSAQYPIHDELDPDKINYATSWMFEYASSPLPAIILNGGRPTSDPFQDLFLTGARSDAAVNSVIRGTAELDTVDIADVTIELQPSATINTVHLFDNGPITQPPV